MPGRNTLTAVKSFITLTPGGQEDAVLSAENVAEMAEDVGVSGRLQPDAKARQHEEDVGQDVDLAEKEKG